MWIFRCYVIALCFLLHSKNCFAQNITTVAGTGVGGYSGDSELAINCELQYPSWFEVDVYGNFYLSDAGNNVIRKINTSGIVSTIAGTGVEGYSGDSGPAINARLKSQTGIKLDKNGNLYVADYGNHVIRKINTSGIISTIAGIGIAGYSGDGSLAISAKLSLPYAIDIDTNSNIIFSDAGNHCVRKISTSGIITTIAGNGSTGYSGDGGMATNARMTYPGFLAVDRATNEIFVPDWGNRCIRKIDHLGIITTIAGTGILGNSGDGGHAKDANMNAPNAVNFDNNGNYYISDNLAHVIRKVNTSGIISTIAGNGIQGYSPDGTPATAANLHRPNCTRMDNTGNIYFLEVYNHMLRRINYHSEVISPKIGEIDKTFFSPNPVSESIVITNDNSIYEVVIADVLGKRHIVLAFISQEKMQNISVSNLPKGVYLLQVNGLYSGKFVKI